MVAQLCIFIGSSDIRVAKLLKKVFTYHCGGNRDGKDQPLLLFFPSSLQLPERSYIKVHRKRHFPDFEVSQNTSYNWNLDSKFCTIVRFMNIRPHKKIGIPAIFRLITVNE